jgi:K+-transporting ATPase ATPase C chain
MKTAFKQSFVLTVILIVLFAFVYPLTISFIALLSPGKGNGVKLSKNEKVIGYENIGQKFYSDRYFQGRPSAVDYNAAGSAGSNKGTTNPDYLKTVKERIDTFLVHNPEVKRENIPADLITASASGLDPDISPDAAYIQIKRISKERNLSEEQLKVLVGQQIEGPLFDLFGPSKVNVLKLNLALDNLSHK